MDDLGNRIQELRKKFKLSQIDLADKISISKSQMIRYENKGVQPPADVLNRLADIFETSVDFLINGNSDQKAMASLKNSELLYKFKEVEVLPEREQSILVEIMGAYIRDFKSRQNYASAI